MADMTLSSISSSFGAKLAATQSMVAAKEQGEAVLDEIVAIT